MREIKFRALCDDDSCHYLGVNKGDWVFGWLCDGFILQGKNPFEIKTETIGQYTGLKDKYGQEIYEGDIVRAPHDFGPAGFSERTFAVHFSVERGYQWEFWIMDEAVVLGNIYENPELLEQAA